MIVDGIKYEKVNGQVYEMLLFEETEIEAYANRMCDIGNGIYDCVEVESDTERVLAEAMSGRQDIKLLIKLPDWFQVETPIDTYNPHWAIFRHGPAPAVRLCAARGPNLTATLSLPA